jgi:hypothetical protein
MLQGKTFGEIQAVVNKIMKKDCDATEKFLSALAEIEK